MNLVIKNGHKIFGYIHNFQQIIIIWKSMAHKYDETIHNNPFQFVSSDK